VVRLEPGSNGWFSRLWRRDRKVRLPEHPAKSDSPKGGGH